MLNIRVMPCLLLQQGKLVKTVRFKNPNYIGDPVNAVKIYNDKELDELVLLDIDATKRETGIDFAKIKDVASECFMPLAYGGGIKSVKDAAKIFSLGVEKIVINSIAVERPDNIGNFAKLFGSQSIVVSIDVKKNTTGKYEVCFCSGTKVSKYNPVEFAKMVEAEGAGEIFLNSIDQDGTFLGFDLELIKQVTQAVNIPVIVCGGAASVNDFGEAVKAGASAVAIGSMAVYHNNHTDGVLINFPLPEEIRKVIKDYHA